MKPSWNDADRGLGADLPHPRWMYLKAILLLVIGGLSFGLLLLPQTLALRVALQVLMIWAFARAYYFVFYVIEHYIDDRFRFAGLLDFLRYLLRKRGDGSSRS